MTTKESSIERFEKAVQHFTADCVLCGICLEACPSIPYSDIRKEDPQKIVEEMKAGFEGGPLSFIVIERAFACTRCGICLDICPQEINVFEVLQALRAKILDQGKRKLSLTTLPVGDHILTDWDVDDILAGLQVKPWERRWADSGVSDIQKSDTVLFIGCHSRRYVSAINTLLDIFQMLGINLTAVAGGSVCCGARFSGIGKFNIADKQGIQLISYLTEYSPKEVFVQCPMCLYNIRKEIPKLTKIPFRVRHVFDVIAEKLEDFRFTRMVEKKVTYHDPCKLGRMSGDYEYIRKIFKAIPGLEFIEMPESKEESLCCGGAAWRSNPNVARALREKAMDSAAEVDPDILATACQFCHQNFYSFAAAYPYRVGSALEIIGAGLGIKYENKLTKYYAFHDPERVIEETRDYIEAGSYTLKEVRQVLRRVMP